MSTETTKTPEYKSLRESLYQKKGALQEIYDLIKAKRYSPEETIDLVEKLCKVSGVYIPRED